MAKRKTYSDKFKAGALTLLQSEGYPEDKYALERVAQRVKVPSRTLRRWSNGEHGEPPVDVVRECKKELAELFEDEIRAALDEMPQAREGASYRDLVTGAAILTDKVQLLVGKPTERTDVNLTWRTIVDAARNEAGADDGDG